MARAVAVIKYAIIDSSMREKHAIILSNAHSEGTGVRLPPVRPCLGEAHRSSAKAVPKVQIPLLEYQTGKAALRAAAET